MGKSAKSTTWRRSIYILLPVIGAGVISGVLAVTTDIPWERVASICGLLSLVLSITISLADVRQHPLTSVQLKNSFEHQVSDTREDQYLPVDIEGAWIGNYSYTDLETGHVTGATEEVVIRAKEPGSHELRGDVTDDGGQHAEVVGELIGNKLMFYFISRKTNRPSYGCAVLQLDNQQARSMEGILVFHDLDQQSLACSRYRLTKAG